MNQRFFIYCSLACRIFDVVCVSDASFLVNLICMSDVTRTGETTGEYSSFSSPKATDTYMYMLLLDFGGIT